MKKLRLALAQINPTVGALAENAQKVIEYIKEAEALGADMVAFPEMVIPGYPPEDLLLKPQFIKDNLAQLQRVVEATGKVAAVVGFVDQADDIYNAAAVIHNGRLVGVYRKMFLPNYGVFDEDRYFKPGREALVFIVNGVGVGITISEDIWYATGPATLQRAAGAQVIITINASPYHMGKKFLREKMLATRAMDCGVFLAYLNMVGGQDELVFDGNSMVFNPEGRLIAEGSQFEEDFIVVDLDIEELFRSYLHYPLPRKDRTLENGPQGARRVPVSEHIERERPPLAERRPQVYDPIGEVYHALVLGTRDYVYKSGFKKVVIGLSGGIDSSLVATIATDALGRENVLGVAMPSRYSSEASLRDARDLARNLGIELLVIPIEKTFTAYLETLSEAFKGTSPDVTEENIQARIRGNLLMAISNKFGRLVLTTGNKSEMATGYATLYGDMAGGFAVIKDVPKTLVYKLAEWRNRNGEPPDVIPQNVLIKAPSAELRPDQKDEDTLPPYPILDPILKAYVEEDRSFEAMVAAGFDEETVKKVITMVDRSEYKRRQAPPGIKVTPRAFGCDRRLPIVNHYRPF